VVLLQSLNTHDNYHFLLRSLTPICQHACHCQHNLSWIKLFGTECWHHGPHMSQFISLPKANTNLHQPTSLCVAGLDYMCLLAHEEATLTFTSISHVS